MVRSGGVYWCSYVPSRLKYATRRFLMLWPDLIWMGRITLEGVNGMSVGKSVREAEGKGTLSLR